MRSTELSLEKVQENPGNLIPGYCFTDKEACPKISPVTHNCVAWIDPKTKCRNIKTIGCSFAPGRDLSKEMKEQKRRIGQQKGRAKRSKLNKVASRTSGKSKGGNCVASPLEKFCAKYSRAYKKEFYGSVMASIAKRK